jgi:hypothetical protein
LIDRKKEAVKEANFKYKTPRIMQINEEIETIEK